MLGFQEEGEEEEEELQCLTAGDDNSSQHSPHGQQLAVPWDRLPKARDRQHDS